MLAIYLDEGRAEWLEPQTDADRDLIDEAQRGCWTFDQLYDVARTRGLFLQKNDHGPAELHTGWLNGKALSREQ